MELYEWFLNLVWWQYLIVGAAIWFAVQNFVIPDPQAIWLAKRENGLVAVVPVAAVLFLIGLGNLVVALFSSVKLSWVAASIEPWVWWFAAIGLALILIYVIYRRANYRPIRFW